MKKQLLFVFGLLFLGATITAFAYSLLPSAAEVQIGAHNRDEDTRLQAEKTLQEKSKIEWQSFCLMIDLMRAERMEVSFEQNKRYRDTKCGDIHGKYDLLKLPEEFNSNGEKHPDLFIGEGSTQKDKIKSFVERNCIVEIAEVFEEVYAYAESSGLNPAVPFAIIAADSTCGKNMTTPNNPGNVHNNDRGNRVGFFTMIDGINAVTDTLNNQYINGIEKIGHLSQGGRTEIGSVFDCASAPVPYKCYASSGENWNNNTQRALRAMGYQNVDGNFLIRK